MSSHGESQRLLHRVRSDLVPQGDADNTLLRTVAWQQSVIFNLVAGLASGSKGDLERSQAFAGLPTTFCRRQNWLSEPVVNDMFESSFSLETRWKRWRDREEIKRLGFGAIVSLIYHLRRVGTDGDCADVPWTWDGHVGPRGLVVVRRGCQDVSPVSRLSLGEFNSSRRVVTTDGVRFLGSIHCRRVGGSLPRIDAACARTRDARCDQPPHGPIAARISSPPLRRARYVRLVFPPHHPEPTVVASAPGVARHVVVPPHSGSI